MGKILTLILLVLAIALIAFNVTLVDFKDPFEKNSGIALIGIIASLCAIVLILIFNASKKIKDKIDRN